MKEAQFIEIVQNAALQYIQDKESLGIKPGDKFCLFKPLLQAGSYPTKDTMNLLQIFVFMTKAFSIIWQNLMVFSIIYYTLLILRKTYI